MYVLQLCGWMEGGLGVGIRSVRPALPACYIGGGIKAGGQALHPQLVLNTSATNPHIKHEVLGEFEKKKLQKIEKREKAK